MVKHGIGIAAALLLLAGSAGAQEPFGIAIATEGDSAPPRRLRVALTVPANHYLYADEVAIEPHGLAWTVANRPRPRHHFDPFFEKKTAIYDRDVQFVYDLPAESPAEWTVTVSLQGCNESVCFPPWSGTFRVTADGTVVPVSDDEPDVDAGKDGGLDGFTVVATATGYLNPEALLAFLERARTGEPEPDRLQAALNRSGLGVVLLMILLGGLALNLTPCVLPMMPVNLAIIGAGAQAGSRTRGFALGTAYGAGIALVYGALGLLVILTGRRFGAINASPWFNFAVAGVFVWLALAMFNVFTLDLSRFQGRSGADRRPRGSFAAALALGGVSALLAGACVAPVVVSVLLLAADLQARGHAAGLVLPFVLGIGMALPWPFAGAGLSFLPRPGRWMERVKIGFGVMILLFAIGYAKIGFSTLVARGVIGRQSSPAATAAPLAEEWHVSFDEARRDAARDGRAIFVDIWASWCKNCLKMEASTFPDPRVQQALESFVKLKYRAEDLSAAESKAILDRFGVVGLPTYVVLRPTTEPDTEE